MKAPDIAAIDCALKVKQYINAIVPKHVKYYWIDSIVQYANMMQ